MIRVLTHMPRDGPAEPESARSIAGRFLASLAVSLGLFAAIGPMLSIGRAATCYVTRPHEPVCWQCVADEIDAILHPYCPIHRPNPEGDER